MMNTWDKFETWDLVLPPSRPDQFELDQIREYVSVFDKATPCAVLGSTPEFRDLLVELNFENVYIFDKNVSFYDKMSRNRIYANGETLEEGDWLDTLGGYKENFSFILSDLTSGNVPYDQRKAFYSHIEHSLIEGGMFIDKNLTNEKELITIDKIIDKYSNMPINLRTFNDFSCEAIFCSTLQLVNGLIDTNFIYSELEKALTSMRLQRIIAGSQFVTPKECVWYYGVDWNELSADYVPNLNLVAKNNFPLASPYYGRGFQFVWQK